MVGCCDFALAQPLENDVADTITSHGSNCAWYTQSSAGHA